MFSASLANELACTAEALYARGDAGGQLYAAARGLHECCGDVASIAQSLQSQQKLVIQPGARAAACVVLGALCATYPRRLGPSALGEARQRLAKLAKNDQSTKAAAARALGRVVLASPDEGVTGVAPRPVQTCVEIKILRRVHACSMAWRCRFVTTRRSQHGRVIAEK